MIPSQSKSFRMKEKVGKASLAVRCYIADCLRTAHHYPPNSEWRAYYIGMARGTASMWPLCKHQEFYGVGISPEVRARRG